MLHTTRAIVLRSIRHGDRTLVLKVYTEQFGLRSYMVRAGTKKGTRLAMLQPLNRLEIVVTEHPERDLGHAQQIVVRKPYMNIASDPLRGALALFTQEVLYKVLREESANKELYRFLEHSLEVMDSHEDIRHFPLMFLLGLAEQLGFYPARPASGEDRFDLLEGYFLKGDAPHGHTMGPPLSTALIRLLEAGTWAPMVPAIPMEYRRQLLDHLLLYYRLHVDGLGEFRSPAVLHQVLS